MRCSVSNCINGSKNNVKNRDVLYHRFPKEACLKLEWLMRCNKRGCKLNPDSSYICSLHFTKQDYFDDRNCANGQEAELKHWAVPSLKLPRFTQPFCILERLDPDELKEIAMKKQMKITDLSVEDLKGELRKRNLPLIGPKIGLIKRLKKALTDSGEDPDSYVFNKDGDDGTAKANETTEKSKEETKPCPTSGAKKTTPSKNAENDESKSEDTDAKKATDDPSTPKRPLRRSTRERSPVVQVQVSTPTKTPRAKGKAATKLAPVSEEEESSAKDTKLGNKSEKAVEEGKDKTSPVKKESESSKSKDSEETGNSEEKDQSGNKTTKKSSEKEDDVEMDEEEGQRAELDLDLEDMEQPDYEEEELNFDCGSTFISDNDADLDDTRDDGKAKAKRKSSVNPKKQSNTAEKSDGSKDTEEDKDSTNKSADKNLSEKEEARDAEKGADSKDEPVPKDLWVTGLSGAAKAADVKQAFLKHGKVISTKIVMNPKMPGSQCFGIVTVASQDDAIACVKALNMTDLLGRLITVKIIARKKDKKDDALKKRKDETGRDKSDDKKDVTSPRKDTSKFSDMKERRDREMRRDRSEDLRKRLSGPHRGAPPPPWRRSPGYAKRRQQEVRNEDMLRKRREFMERKREAMARRMAEEAHHQEAMRLNREREMLRMERERIEKEKVELLRLERERLEREKEEVRKQHMRLEEVRRKREFGGPRDDFDSRQKRPMNERHFSDRRPVPPQYSGGSPPYRRDERPGQGGGYMEQRDRYEGGDNRRHDGGWRGREEGGGRGGWSGGDKGNNEQWGHQGAPSHDRNWNSGGKGRGGYDSNSRGGGTQSQNYNRDVSNNVGSGGSGMNPYPPQQHNFNPYPPPKY